LQIYVKKFKIKNVEKGGNYINKQLLKVKSNLKKLSFDEGLILFNIIMIFSWYRVSPYVTGITALFFLFVPKKRAELLKIPKIYFLSAWMLLTFVTGLVCLNFLGVASGLLFDLFIVFALYTWVVMTQELSEKIIILVSFMSILVFIYAVIEFLITHKRTSSTFFNPNFYGYLCELIFVICLYALLKINRFKLLFLLGLVANSGGIALSGCRSAIYAVVIGVLILLLCLKKYLPFIIGLSVTLISGAAVLIFPQLIPRSGDMTDTIRLRELIWSTAINGILKHPIFGEGFLSYYFITSGEAHRAHAHNLLLDALVNYGVVGTTISFIFLISAILMWIKKLKFSPICALPLALLAATMVHGITDVPVVGYQTGTLVMAMLALSGVVKMGQKRTILN